MVYQFQNSKKAKKNKGIRIELYDSLEKIKHLKSKWNMLVLQSQRPNIFQTWEWVKTWWEHFGNKREVCIITAMNDSGQLVGILPAWIGSISIFLGVEFPFFGSIEDKGPIIACIRQPGMGLIGDGSPVCPEYLGPIIRKDNVKQVIKKMLGSLISASENWLVMRFSDLFNDSVSTRIFITHLTSRYAVELSEGEKCYYHPLPESYDDFFNQLSRNKRKSIRRNLKSAKENFKIMLEVITKPDDVKRGFKNISIIYKKSERGLKNIGGWRLEEYRDFHREVALAFSKNGWLRLYILWFDDNPVAFLYCYFFSGILSAYQTGFNLDYQKHGPGSIILQKGIEDGIKQGAKEFDYLRGDEHYKFSFAKMHRCQKNIMVFRNRGVSYIAYRTRCKLAKIISRFQNVC